MTFSRTSRLPLRPSRVYEVSRRNTGCGGSEEVSRAGSVSLIVWNSRPRTSISLDRTRKRTLGPSVYTRRPPMVRDSQRARLLMRRQKGLLPADGGMREHTRLRSYLHPRRCYSSATHCYMKKHR